MVRILADILTLARGIRGSFKGVVRNTRISSLTLLLTYLRPYRRQALGAGGALLASSALLLALGQGVRRLIDLGFASDSEQHLDTAALGMFCIVALLAAATFSRFYLISWLGERIGGDLRREIFGRVISLSPAFLETARTGDILTRLTSDISVLQTLIGSAISVWLRNAILFIGAFGLLIATSPKLTALILLVIPFVLIPLVVFGRRERRLSRAAQERVAALGAYAEETVNALRTVQAFTHEPLDRVRFSAEVEHAVTAATRRIASRATLLFGVIFLGFGAIIFSM